MVFNGTPCNFIPFNLHCASQLFVISARNYSLQLVLLLLKCFLKICAGNGLDVDEYVRKAYKFAYSDCIEVGPVACLPEPPDPNELYPRQSSR